MPADLLSVIVGDDTGSRLFWELVDPGYVETADLGFQEFDGSGAYLCYFSCALKTYPPTRLVCRRSSTTSIARALRKPNCRRPATKSPRGSCCEANARWAAWDHWATTGNTATNTAPVAADLETVASITTADIRRLLAQYPLQMQTTSTVGPLPAEMSHG